MLAITFVDTEPSGEWLGTLHVVGVFTSPAYSSLAGGIRPQELHVMPL